MTQAQSQTRYLLSDGLGSIRQVTNESGQVVAGYDYDPYGNPIGGHESGYGYTGEFWQSELGLLHLRARWYDPSTGTFLSKDPIESEPPYAYVHGNPINLRDPSGKVPPLPITLTDEDMEDFDPLGDVFDALTMGWLERDSATINEEAYIIGVIRNRREEIKAAAYRHNLDPAFLAAILYLENSNAKEQLLQHYIGDFSQQCSKYLWNVVNPISQDSGVYGENINLGIKRYPYFKPGRSQGIGAIKPEVAVYVEQLSLVYDPSTGQRINFGNYDEGGNYSISVDLGNMEQYGIHGLNGVQEFGFRRHPTKRVNMMIRLAQESWSIEYLAAHLEAARTPLNKDPGIWPECDSCLSEKDRQRLMVTYHHNVDNLNGWNDSSSDAYGAATKVINWMPEMRKLLGLE